MTAFVVENLSAETERILESFSSHGAVLTLESGADEPLKCMTNGEWFFFEPHGTLEIRDIRTHKKNLKGESLEQLEVTEGNKASVIAQRIIAQLGTRGVVLLSGDPVVDRRQREEAVAAYLKYRVAEATTINDDWLETCRKVPEGQLKPRPPAKVLKAMADLQRFSLAPSGRKQWISQIDGFDSDDREEVAEHNRTYYADQTETDDCVVDRDSRIRNREAAPATVNRKITAIDHEARTVTLEDVEPPPARVVPIKPNPSPPTPKPFAQPAAETPETTFQFWVRTADEWGVNLSRKHLLGLGLEDAEIIDQVKGLCAAKRAAREAMQEAEE